MASIFYLPEQFDLIESIRSLLRENVHPDLDVRPVEIDPKYGKDSDKDMHKRCREYVDFLRASLVTSDPFAVVIKNDLETWWCYMGLINSVAAPTGYCFELKNSEMTALFPALVLMNRIVMLPEQFDGAVNKHPRTFLSLTRPLNFSGLELVDYSSKLETRLAIGRIADQFRGELRSIIHRQKFVRRLHSPDYDELSSIVKEKASILRLHDIPSSEIRIDARVEGRAVEGTPSPISVLVTNLGVRTLKNVRVRVRAPKNALTSSVSVMASLEPPDAIKVDFEIIAKVAPLCPLEIFVDLGEAPLEMPTFPIPVFVEVDRPSSS